MNKKLIVMLVLMVAAQCFVVASQQPTKRSSSELDNFPTRRPVHMVEQLPEKYDSRIIPTSHLLYLLEYDQRQVDGKLLNGFVDSNNQSSAAASSQEFDGTIYFKKRFAQH